MTLPPSTFSKTVPDNQSDDGYFRQTNYPTYGPPINPVPVRARSKRRILPTTKEMKTNFRDNLSYCKSLIFKRKKK